MLAILTGHLSPKYIAILSAVVGIPFIPSAPKIINEDKDRTTDRHAKI